MGMMKLGDKVTRNPKYPWCICAGYRGCWCRAGGEWEIVFAEARKGCASGVMVVAALCVGRGKTDLLDSSHFISKD